MYGLKQFSFDNVMLSLYFGRYAFGYADLRFATVHSRKTRQAEARFLNALGSTPPVEVRKKVRSKFASDLLWWGTFLLNRISAATPRLQTFAPVDVSDAVDAEVQPLAAEGIAFFVLRGHTDADLCF